MDLIVKRITPWEATAGTDADADALGAREALRLTQSANRIMAAEGKSWGIFSSQSCRSGVTRLSSLSLMVRMR